MASHIQALIAQKIAASTNSATRVQARHAYPSTTGATSVLAYSSNVTAGNLLVCMVSFNRTSTFTRSIADTLGNTWTFGTDIDFTDAGVDNTYMVTAWCIANGSGPNTVTFSDLSLNGFGDGGQFNAEYSAPAGFAATPLDVQGNTCGMVSCANDATATTTTPTSASFSPTQRDLILAFYADEHTAQSSIVAGSGYTLIQADATHADAQEENLGVNSGARTASFTLGNASNHWIIKTLAFKIN